MGLFLDSATVASSGRYLYYIITLNISTCFVPQWSIIRESNQSSTA